MPENFEGLGRHPAGFDRRHGPQPGGRLHGQDRDRRAAEGARSAKSPQIGGYSRATARVQATDRQGADGCTPSAESMGPHETARS
jgi:hypothetical protein